MRLNVIYTPDTVVNFIHFILTVIYVLFLHYALTDYCSDFFAEFTIYILTLTYALFLRSALGDYCDYLFRVSITYISTHCLNFLKRLIYICFPYMVLNPKLFLLVSNLVVILYFIFNFRFEWSRENKLILRAIKRYLSSIFRG